MPTLLIPITALVAVLICVGCLLPPDRLPHWLPNDKLMHLCGYFLLMVLISALTRNLLLGAVILFIAGLLIECLQYFVPGRSFCWPDQLANTVGIMLGLGLVVVSGEGSRLPIARLGEVRYSSGRRYHST